MKLTFDEIYNQRKKNFNNKKNDLYFWLPDIRSVYNIGSIFRLGDALNIKKIFLSGFSATPSFCKDLNKSAIGAQDTVDWEYFKDHMDVIQKLKQDKIFMLGLEQTKKSISVFEYIPTFPLCIVVGNEITGINDDILEYIDFFVDIPMYGKKHSLNVAVSISIASYVLFFNGLKKIN